MNSKVVRIVNLHEHVSDEWLTNKIQQRVRLVGQIKNIYIRTYVTANIIFAYVVFEESIDAKRTMEALDETTHEHNEWDVKLIGPLERCSRYMVLSEDEDEYLEDLKDIGARSKNRRTLSTWRLLRKERQRKRTDFDIAWDL